MPRNYLGICGPLPQTFPSTSILFCVLAVIASMTLSACTYFPDEGPSAHRVLSSSAKMNYTVVDLDMVTATKVANYYATQPSWPAWTQLPPGSKIGVVGPGDILTITLWDANYGASGEGLTPGSISAGFGKGLTLETSIDGAGTISVPFAGRWRVADEPPSTIEQDLVDKLHSQFVDIQASVLVKGNLEDTVFFEGDVTRPGRIDLPPNGLRLLDGLALAGGPKDPAHANAITFERQHHIAHWSLAAAVNSPGANIMLSPGDRVTISSAPAQYFAFGAVNRPGAQKLSAGDSHLADLVGEMAGLQDQRANPEGFFIFRREPRALAEKLSPSSSYTDSAEPIVYRVDMRNPVSYFVLGAFPVQAGDVIYVSNAPIAEVAKFVQLISGFGSSIQTGQNLGSVP